MEQAKKWMGLRASTLKLIAVITMLIDHIAAAVLARMLLIDYGNGGGVDQKLYMVYMVMRQIGRTAFPIYCYMIVEGLEHTRNKWKYAARLGVGALISEIPFDLALKSTILEFEYQNVYFTLLFGLITLIGIQYAEKYEFFPANGVAGKAVRASLIIGIGLTGMKVASIFHTDYGAAGVLCIIILYVLRQKKVFQLLACYVAFVLFLGEIAALPAFVLMALYRGRKGFTAKWFFYGFYPVHLLLLYLTCAALGISYCSAI